MILFPFFLSPALPRWNFTRLPVTRYSRLGSFYPDRTTTTTTTFTSLFLSTLDDYLNLFCYFFSFFFSLSFHFSLPPFSFHGLHVGRSSFLSLLRKRPIDSTDRLYCHLTGFSINLIRRNDDFRHFAPSSRKHTKLVSCISWNGKRKTETEKNRRRTRSDVREVEERQIKVNRREQSRDDCQLIEEKDKRSH